MGLPEFFVPFDCNILSCIWPCNLGHHRLAKLSRIPQLVPTFKYSLTTSEKVVSLFIHIMPPVVLHTVLHLMPPEYSHKRFPAVKETSQLYLFHGLWIASLVHTAWQGWYYYFIMVRRREKIEAGRPTSYTWLRRSYAKTWIGKWLHSLPLALQPFAFMGIQVCLWFGEN
jgi:hypothetical protein